MASPDRLTDDQRAVLQMLLRSDNTYEDLAGLLQTDLADVRARARTAIAAIAPDAAEIGQQRRDEITDYLLGQQTVSRSEATRGYLAGSDSGRRWASALARALSPLASVALPEIPTAGGEGAFAVAPAGPGAAAPPAKTQAAAARGSQVRGRLLAAGIGVVLAIAIVLAISLRGGGEEPTAATSTTSATQATTPTGDAFEIIAQADLRPPSGSQSGVRGEVLLVRFPNNDQYRLGLEARGLPPSSARGSGYGIWLYTSASQKQFLGFANADVGSDGKLEATSDLSPDTPNQRQVLLTRETADAPKQPGTIIARGRLVTAAAQPGGASTSTTPAPSTVPAPSTTAPTTTTP